LIQHFYPLKFKASKYVEKSTKFNGTSPLNWHFTVEILLAKQCHAQFENLKNIHFYWKHSLR